MLNDFKIMLGLSVRDNDMDDKLNIILENTKARLKILLGGIEVPESLNHIVMEVSIIRFNRIGSEGLSTHSVEGESLGFNENDFAQYQNEIDAYLETLENSKRGRLRFL